MGSRLLEHEANCKGWRNEWHTLNGRHVYLAHWDSEESKYMLSALRERHRRYYLNHDYYCNYAMNAHIKKIECAWWDDSMTCCRGIEARWFAD